MPAIKEKTKVKPSITKINQIYMLHLVINGAIKKLIEKNPELVKRLEAKFGKYQQDFLQIEKKTGVTAAVDRLYKPAITQWEELPKTPPKGERTSIYQWAHNLFHLPVKKEKVKVPITIQNIKVPSEIPIAEFLKIIKKETL